MDHNFETPFDNLECAQEYLALLSQVLGEETQNAEIDIIGETSSQSARRRDALRLLLYKLEKLEQHIKTSRRLLNDLRTLRRLLLDERAKHADRVVSGNSICMDLQGIADMAVHCR